MALLRSVLGTVTQSMGGVTATTWKGKNVLKQKVAETNTSNTPAQQKQRRKFAALAKLAGAMGPAIRTGYRVAAAKVTEQNAFYTANKDAVTDDGTTATVNFALLKLSVGIVGGVQDFAVQIVGATGNTAFSWEDNSNGADALPDDIFNGVIVNKLTGQAYIVGGTIPRSDGTQVLNGFVPVGSVPANFVGYGFFKRSANTATGPSAEAQATA